MHSSRRAGEFQRLCRQEPDVQHLRTDQRAVRARVERVQERAGHPCRARLVRQRPKTRFLWRRRYRLAHRPMPIAWSLFAPPPGRTWGAGFKSLLEALPRAMIVAGHGTSLPLETNRIDLDPELKDAWGLPALRMTYKDHPDDLAMARYLQDRGVESMQAAGALEVWKDPVAESTGGPHLLGRRAWATTRRPRSSTSTIAVTTSAPVRLRRLELRDLGPRPADDDHPGARVPRGRPYRTVRETRGDLTVSRR